MEVSSTGPLPSPSRLWRLIWKAVVALLALFGLFCLLIWLVLPFVTGPLFVTEMAGRAVAPDRKASAEIVVRRGGLGTVHTVRVLLKAESGEEWLVYEAKD